MSRQKFVTNVQVTPELLSGANHEKVDLWLLMLPWDALKETATIDRLSVPTHPESHPYAESISITIFGSAERLEPDEEEPLTMGCPSCGVIQPDLDGFGVLYCPACGYCQHASVTDDICGFCRKLVRSCSRCNGRGALVGIEVGFGGIDDGAECPECEGVGMIVEEALRCKDCGLLYRDFPLDVVLPDEQWTAVHPEGEGGVLCAQCIVQRAARIKGVTVAKLQLEF